MAGAPLLSKKSLFIYFLVLLIATLRKELQVQAVMKRARKKISKKRLLLKNKIAVSYRKL